MKTATQPNRREPYRYRGYTIEPQGDRAWKLWRGASCVANGFTDRAQAEHRVDENLSVARYLARLDRGDAL